MRILFLGLLTHGLLLVAGDITPVPRPKPVAWSEVKADADGRAWLSAGDKPASEWELVDTGATLEVPPGSTVAVFAASKPGRYRVVAVADGKLVRCVVVVGSQPEPGPAPGPVDELTRRLQTAYDADQGGTLRAADLRQLVALYQEAVTFAKQDSFSNAGQLFAEVSRAAASLLPDDPVSGRRLGGVRKVIAADLVTVLPTDPDAALTPAIREAAAAAFARYAKALAGVSPGG